MELDEMIKKLYITNEYGVSYVDYYANPHPDLVAHYVDNYNISTILPNGKEISSSCLTCQIVQCNKYRESQEWCIRFANQKMHQEPDETSPVSAKLRKNQVVTLLTKEGEWAKVQTSSASGYCIECPEEHPVIIAESPSVIEQATCETCGNAMRAKINKNVGWVKAGSLTYFKITCDFIPKKYELPAKLTKTLNKEQQDYAMSLIDPVKWVRKFLGRDPRETQTVFLMCSAKNRVLRWGRRGGKTWGECFDLLRFTLTEQIEEGRDAHGKPIYRGPKVLVATPFLSQIELVFGILDELLARNPDIEVKRRVRTPFHTIEFPNGGEIKGFTTGVQSKQEASTLLGQSADLILLDEVDRIGTEDIIRAIRPIQITTPNVRLMASSTPTGKREWFYQSCCEDARFKEFHFPSTTLAHWELIKDDAESDGTKDHFMQEYMAEFTVQLEGVYQASYVSGAETPYQYLQKEPYRPVPGLELYLDKPTEGFIYTMGVDWNTNAGVEIVVGGLDPRSYDYYIVEALNIPKQDFQQRKAMDVVLRLNERWLPTYIYVDAGYGRSQIEILREYALRKRTENPQDPAGRLLETLHSYDFGSKMEYRDPVTQQIKRTNAKAYLVENSVRQFEEGRVHYSSKDPVLTQQLLNYIVEGHSSTGLPRYGMNDKKIGDHRLDALNLAMIPFKLHMTKFSVEGRPVTNVRFSQGFGASMVRNKVVDGEKVFEEFMANIPRQHDGSPAIGGQVLKVLYEPGYVAEKQAERYNKQDFSRTATMDTAKKASNEIRYGFDSDTEWKEKTKPKAKVVIRGHKRPGRRSF